MADTVLQRSATARWCLAVPFALLGLLGIGAAVASGLLTLPGGVLFLSLAVWLGAGAHDPPSTPMKWTLIISGGLTALMFVAGICLAIVNRV